ncbi:hypothetical protein FRC09_013001 [Ceratobasidium sp. 395]|nr:hypothetical protein FRC09_013001 [Ceratobasidium sp. 395]
MSKRIPDICAILGLVDGNMLALEALSIQLLLPPTSVHDQEIELGSPPLNDLLDLLARSPRLRTFQVTKFDYVTGKISSCFSSLKNITRLELMLCVAPVISDLRSLLLNNPHLETLAIEIDDPYATNRDALSLLRDDDTTSVILTRLQTLVLVEGVSMEGWSLRALQLIDAPSLISFRLDIDAWPAASECATLDVPLDYILIETVTERRKAELPLQVVEVGESHWIRLAAETKSHLQNVVERVRPFDDAPAMESRGMEGGEEDDEEEDSEEQDSEES